jgi:hypothetical protein
MPPGGWFRLVASPSRRRLQGLLLQSRRMGGAQRYPSTPRAGAEDDGFRFALPILRRYDFAISRRVSPEVCIVVALLKNLRAQGTPGACCTRGPACDLHKQNCTRTYRAARTLRPSLRNGFTAYFVLSPENGSFASVATQETNPAQLSASTATPEPHDFAVRVRRVRLARPQRPPHLTARS